MRLRERVRRSLTALCAVLSLGLGPMLAGDVRPLSAQEGGSEPPGGDNECCLLLLIPVGGRSSAMAGAITAQRGPEAAFRNPAGLAGLEGTRVVLHHTDIVSINTQVDAVSLILTPLGTSVGVSYQLFDKGNITTTDVSGRPTGELILRDHLLLLSFATPIATGLSAGVNYRLFRQKIGCEGRCGGEESVGTTNAVDVGLRYRPSWHPALELGAAIVNAGPGLQIVNAEQADPLPGRVYLGGAYDVLDETALAETVALRVTGDVRASLRDLADATAAVGLELDVEQAVFLRAGYAPGEGLGTGAAVGLELRYDRFDIAVSRTVVNSQLAADSEPFQVSFALRF